ncbi:MAG: energy-coupling factor transporter ATPase [Eubacteriales bacterium]|jgi:energy-coupling factor transport system ATP-binding protein|nr:energy-coupling factor transporter ATPase [Eubacteriales bacterium]
MRIDVQNLTHIYNEGQTDEVTALDDVSFTVGEGSITGIIGHTGSGKSTLIQHMNGLLKPSSGKIFADGTDITSKDVSMPEIRRKIGLVFQYPEYQLFEETVAKDIAFGPKNLGMSDAEIDKRVHTAMSLTDLDYEKFAVKSPFELSGGQKRRVAIAGVLAMEPEVLILDEPAAGLDPASHRSMMELVRRLNTEHNTTIVLVSHNMDDVAEYCTDVIVMDDGKIFLSGTPREVFRHSSELESKGLGLPFGQCLIREMNRQGADISGDSVLSGEDAAEAVLRWLEEKKC